MGAWFSVRDYIQWTLDNIKANNRQISYIGRSPDASPAMGMQEDIFPKQQEIIKKVLSNKMSENILVPTLGESITEATVSKWLKNEGEGGRWTHCWIRNR